jgi:hypothetical protein
MPFDPLCRAARTRVLFLLGIILLVLLWLVRRWLGSLWLAIVFALSVLGLLFLALVVGAILRKLCREWWASPKGKGSIGHPWTPRKKIPSHTYKRPDPLIYSQGELMAKGIAVTWDNPDIQLFDGGVPVSSADVQPNKVYQIRARIWNGSTEAAAVNMLVNFYYLSFGIGLTRHDIGHTFVDVPVKGAIGHPAFAELDWQTPGAPGHYCLQVELVWPDDANPGNNLGQENLDVKKLNSPNAIFAMPVRNDAPVRRAITMRPDAYVIPALEPCDEPRGSDDRTPPSHERRLAERQARHRRELFPTPEGWTVDIVPAEFALEPRETQIVTVSITSDGSVVPSRAININAFAGDELIGGVTLVVHS